MLERIIRQNRQFSETNNTMKKRIYDNEYPCPCSAKKDMETSEDVYTFLQNLYQRLDTFDWNKFGLADLECAYCNVTENFLELILDRIRLFIKDT